MLTIQTKIQETTDGRQVISMTFEREVPDAAAPCIEAIYQLVESEGSPFNGEFIALNFLSATRTDTREPVVLTPDETRVLLQVAVDRMASR